MKRIYLAITVVASGIAIVAFFYASNQPQHASKNVEVAVNALKNIKYPSIAPNQAKISLESDIQDVRKKLDSATRQIKSIQSKSGMIGPKIGGTEKAVGSIGEVERGLARIEDQSRQMSETNAAYLAALAALQREYEAKIASLEREIDSLSKPKSGVTMEFFVGLAGLVTAVSTLLLAWRKDSREVQALRLEIDKFRAS